MPTTAVLLLQMGGPDSLEAVRPFLKNLFRDREIIRLGPAVLQPLIAAFIVARRTPAVIEKYREIGGASPLRRITEQQAAALEQQLTIPCAVGMRYWHPFTADTLQSLQARGISRLVVLPLYPQYSRATSGSSINDLKRLVAKQTAPMQLTILEQFHDHPG
ncbi:MAG: ferrochelatase, partial [Trichlorobacter sp.]